MKLKHYKNKIDSYFNNISPEKLYKELKKFGIMDKNDYVTLEVAKLLKEKGFTYEIDEFRGIESHWIYDEEGNSYYVSNIGAYDFVDNPDRFQRPKKNYPMPTLQQVNKWLRTKHNLYINIKPDWDEGPAFWLKIYYWDGDDFMDIFGDKYKNYSYEYVYNEGIKLALTKI